MSNSENEKTNLSAGLVAEIRKQAVSEVAKYAILAFIALFGIAATGWWFYLQTKIDNYISAHAAGVPSAAVLAFDSDKKCPEGWNEFEPAAGSVVIGINAKHPLRDHGGSETHQLQIAELPPHPVSVSVNTATKSTVDRHNAGGKDYPIINQDPVTLKFDVGGIGTAFPTMPPFVALRYCRKD